MKRKMSLLNIGIVLVFVISFSSTNSAYGATSIYDEFDSFDTTLWHTADGWGNGRPFGVYWDDLQVTIDNSEMFITCEEGSYRQYKYVSGDTTVQNSANPS